MVLAATCFSDAIPWQDVLYVYVFPRLSLKTLCRLLAVSRQLNDCVRRYFHVCTAFSLTEVGSRFNAVPFEKLTAGNTLIQSLALPNAGDWLSDSILKPVIDANCRLSKIDLTHCTMLSDASLATLSVGCPQLCYMCLRECKWVGSKAFVLLVQGCPLLEHVDVVGCWGLNDTAVTALATSCNRYLIAVVLSLVSCE